LTTVNSKEVDMRRVTWLVTAAVLLALAGCAARPKDLVIGKWQPEGGAGTIEFTKDGDYKRSNGTLTYAGKYTFVEEDVAEIRYDIPDDVFAKLQAARVVAAIPFVPAGLGNLANVAVSKLDEEKQFKGKAKVTVKGDDLTLAFPEFTLHCKQVR
jgi:hypothetical protein